MSSPFRQTLLSFAVGVLLPVSGGAASTPCPDRGPEFFQNQGYTIRKVSMSGFWLLKRSLETRLSFKEMEGQPFTAAALEQQRSVLRETIRSSPMPFDSLVGVTVTGARLVNCTDRGNTKELDIEYPIFSTRLPLASVRTPEHRDLERTNPAEALALAPAKRKLRLTPEIGYDASQKFRVGGRLETHLPWEGTRFHLDGQASSESLVTGASVSGIREREQGFLRQLIWRNAFEYGNRPTDRSILEAGRALGQFSFATKPMGSLGTVFRAGTLFEGGHERTRLQQSNLPARLLAGSSFANWRGFAGIALRSGRQSIAASYGLLLGHTREQVIDYRKQIVDAVYDTRWLLAPHHPFEMNARFTGGFLNRSGPAPVSERFFGGNVETPFMPGSEWVIRANPVMRGIPAYRLNRTSENQVPGGDQFLVLNLTLATPVWGLPLIPDEASQNSEIREKVRGFVTDGADMLVPIFELDDPAQKELFTMRKDALARTTADMEERVRSLQPAVPETLMAAYEACAEKIGDLAADAENITKSTPWRNFIKDDPEERGIPVIVRLCLVDLNGTLKDPELTRLGGELKEHQKVIEQQVARIDTRQARRMAEETLAFPAKVLDTVFDEMTIVSVSPVAVIDVGRIGPATPGLRSMRYSLGAGARFTLASTVSFQLGYAWNIHPQSWEGRGALFLGMQFIDLFGR